MKKIIIACCSLFLFSCSNENSDIDKTPESKLASFEDYLKFMNSETKNSLLIQSVSTLNSPNNLYTISARSLESNSALSFKLDGTEFSPNDVTINNNSTAWSRSDQDLTNLFGKKFDLTFSNNQILARSGSTNETSTNVYIPELINVNVSNLNEGKVVPGTIISWNIDTLNANGMVLAIEYSPLAQKEQTIAETYSTRIMRGSTVQDNGSYTITASDLEHYPDNATLSFYIGRASFIITNDGNPNNDLSVGAYTVVRSDFKIDK